MCTQQIAFIIQSCCMGCKYCPVSCNTVRVVLRHILPSGGTTQYRVIVYGGNMWEQLRPFHTVQQNKYSSCIGMRDAAWRVLDSNQIISPSMPNARLVKRIPQLKTFQSTQNPLSLPLGMHYYFVECIQRDLWLTSCLMASIGYSISRTYNALQKVRILLIPLLYWG